MLRVVWIYQCLRVVWIRQCLRVVWTCWCLELSGYVDVQSCVWFKNAYRASQTTTACLEQLTKAIYMQLLVEYESCHHILCTHQRSVCFYYVLWKANLNPDNIIKAQTCSDTGTLPPKQLCQIEMKTIVCVPYGNGLAQVSTVSSSCWLQSCWTWW